MFGYAPGSLPPFCLAMKARDGAVAATVLVDSELADHDQLACGGGCPEGFVVTDVATLVALSEGKVRAGCGFASCTNALTCAVCPAGICPGCGTPSYGELSSRGRLPVASR